MDRYLRRQCYRSDCRQGLPDPVNPKQKRKCRSARSEEHTSELQSFRHLVCRLAEISTLALHDALPISPLFVNVPWDGVTETSDAVGGSRLVTMTPVAEDGPVFATTML